MNIPHQVQHIITTLNHAGYEAYLVGGCVRDSFLEKEPSDWDITTNADTKTLQSLFPAHTDVGQEFGTVVALMDGQEYEITTFRKESDYTDGRHPSKIEIAASIEEDLSRRDFTINAMAYHPQKGLIDPFNGLGDLKAGMIRCVGNPNNRFAEDALRMLRAIRFAATLGFPIHPTTYNAIKNNAASVYKLSSERVQKEFVKTLISDNPQYIKMWQETGLSEILMPEFSQLFQTPQNNPHHIYNVGDHTMTALANSQNIKEVRLAVFFHDFGKTICKQTDENGIDHFHGHAVVSENLARQLLKNLHFDNKTIETVSRLVGLHENRFPDTEKSVRKFLSSHGKELLDLLLYVQTADILGQAPLSQKQTELAAIEHKRQIMQQLEKEEGRLTTSSLMVNGNDLKEAGLEGAEIGAMLRSLLEYVIEDPSRNTKDILMQYVDDQIETYELEP